MEAAVTLIVVKPSLYSILWSLAFSLWFLSFSLLFKRKNYWPKSGPLHCHGPGYITHPSLHIQNIGIYIYLYLLHCLFYLGHHSPSPPTSSLSFFTDLFPYPFALPLPIGFHFFLWVFQNLCFTDLPYTLLTSSWKIEAKFMSRDWKGRVNEWSGPWQALTQ